MNSIKPDQIIELEPSFIKVPYEQLRKSFKHEYKYLEKELIAVQDNIESCLNDAELSTEKAAETIDSLMKQVKKLMLKMEKYKQEGEKHSRRIEKRVMNLNEIDKVTSPKSPEFMSWSKTRLNRLIVDYLLRQGLAETAKSVAAEGKIEDLVDIELFEQAEKIEQALESHSCKECLQWCSENRSSLKKMKSTLEFNLRLQEHIELARASKGIEAIKYAQKHLAPWKSIEGVRIGQAMGLLAYKSDTQCQPYKDLYDEKRWLELVEQFRSDYYALCSLTPHPMMSITLQAGLSALKTPQCYEHENKNVNCPVCDSDTLGKLAEKLPLSHHVNSTLVCRISGKIMNEDNPPMLLPNRRVYSQNALNELAAKNDGYVASIILGSIVDHFSTRHQTDPIAMNCFYLRKTVCGHLIIEIEEQKMNSKGYCVVSAVLKQKDVKLPLSTIRDYQPDEWTEKVHTVTTMGHIDSEQGLTVFTQNPQPPSLEHLVPFNYAFIGDKVSAKFDFHNFADDDRPGKPEINQVIQFIDARPIDFKSIPFWCDMFITPPALLGDSVHGGPIWCPTMQLEVQFKSKIRNVSEIISHFLAHHIINNRFDIDGQIWDLQGNIIATTRHQCLIVPWSRNSKEEKKGTRASKF
ncbi:hypothetical protein G6F25_000753 [Rhizopus arrhizus]|nr:hypothetical protein G6F25_000753 [Rhizopus arrhizus]KAG1287246.1 hypothetical protein G6F65_001633 [Rhizopus arrhizus]